MKLTCDPKRADALFIYYFFTSPIGQHALLMNTSQTGVPAISRPVTSLKAVQLALPPLPEQRAIAGILGTLDDKIESNRRMSDTLDVMSRALFKSWFVDFDPVRAKSEGRDAGLPSHLADLFPARLIDSELGPIPGGWRVTLLGDVCRRVAIGPFGSDIKTDNFVAAGVPVIRGGNLTRGFVDDGFVFLSEAKANDLRNANAFPGDIVITHRGTLGQVGLIPATSRFKRYVISQSQMLLSTDLDYASPRYVFEFLRSPSGQHALLANVSQTGVPAISRPTTSLKEIKLLLPPGEILEAFGRVGESLAAKSESITRESRTLLSIRDTLLPSLISGTRRLVDPARFRSTS